MTEINRNGADALSIGVEPVGGLTDLPLFGDVIDTPAATLAQPVTPPASMSNTAVVGFDDVLSGSLALSQTDAPAVVEKITEPCEVQDPGELVACPNDDLQSIGGPSADGGERRCLTPADEFKVPLCDLVEWHLNPGLGLGSNKAKSKSGGQNTPDLRQLPPLMVMCVDSGKFAVLTDLERLHQLREKHGADSKFAVRVVEFKGNDREAIKKLCDDRFGNGPMPHMVQALLIYYLKQAHNLQQKEVCAMYPFLSASSVSDRCIAAATFKALPVVFDILKEPANAPLSYAIAISNVRRSKRTDEAGKLEARAKAILESGKKLTPKAALKALGIADQAPATTKPAKLTVTNANALVDHLQNQIGSIEHLSDGAVRIAIPDRAKMSGEKRLAVFNALTAHLREYLQVGESDPAAEAAEAELVPAAAIDAVEGERLEAEAQLKQPATTPDFEVANDEGDDADEEAIVPEGPMSNSSPDNEAERRHATGTV